MVRERARERKGERREGTKRFEVGAVKNEVEFFVGSATQTTLVGGR